MTTLAQRDRLVVNAFQALRGREEPVVLLILEPIVAVSAVGGAI